MGFNLFKNMFSHSRQSCKSGWAFRVGPVFGPGSGLRLSKCFGPILSLYTNRFNNIRKNDFILP